MRLLAILFALAFGLATGAVQAAPDDAASLVGKANAKFKQGDLNGAIADYTRAVEVDPKYAIAYNNRGLVKRANGNMTGAVSDFSKAIELDPKNVDAYTNRGQLRYERKAWNEALADYRRLRELQPNDDYTRYRIWLVRSRLGERQTATAELKEYLSKQPASAKNEWSRKIGAFLSDQLPESNFLEAAAAKDDKTAKERRCEAYYYAGSKRLLVGHKDTARRYFEQSLQTGQKTFEEYKNASAELVALNKP